MVLLGVGCIPRRIKMADYSFIMQPGRKLGIPRKDGITRIIASCGHI